MELEYSCEGLRTVNRKGNANVIVYFQSPKYWNGFSVDGVSALKSPLIKKTENPQSLMGAIRFYPAL